MNRDGSGSDPSTHIGSGHTGLIIADQGDEVLTIDGNVSNSVDDRVRKKSELVGYLRWW